MKLYQRIAAEFTRQIHAGILRPGERLPSVRTVSNTRRVSPNTVLQAFRLLEDGGEIHARARSGHYVSQRRASSPSGSQASRPHNKSASEDIDDLHFGLLHSLKTQMFMPLASPYPDLELLPLVKLATALATAARRYPERIHDVVPSGNAELRRLVARRYVEYGTDIPTDEIVVTAGALEAVNMALQAVTRPGDLVAVGSPALRVVLLALERLQLKPVELPSDPNDGLSLPALADAIARQSIKACCLMTNFQDPHGSLMPENKKRELVDLLARRGIPLIENDVYAELYYGEERPKPAKAFDREGLVLHCGSFSKCLAPGYRVGWVAAGRYTNQVERVKFSGTVATNIPAQEAIVHFLKHGGYNHHLRKLRRALRLQRDHLLQAIGRYFPAGTRTTRPEGGTGLWVEMPEHVNVFALHRLAMENKIDVIPGPAFSGHRRQYQNCLRLSYGHWSPKVEAAVATLGNIAASLA